MVRLIVKISNLKEIAPKNWAKVNKAFIFASIFTKILLLI